MLVLLLLILILILLSTPLLILPPDFIVNQQRSVFDCISVAPIDSPADNEQIMVVKIEGSISRTGRGLGQLTGVKLVSSNDTLLQTIAPTELEPQQEYEIRTVLPDTGNIAHQSL